MLQIRPDPNAVGLFVLDRSGFHYHNFFVRPFFPYRMRSFLQVWIRFQANGPKHNKMASTHPNSMFIRGSDAQAGAKLTKAVEVRQWQNNFCWAKSQSRFQKSEEGPESTLKKAQLPTADEDEECNTVHTPATLPRRPTPHRWVKSDQPTRLVRSDQPSDLERGDILFFGVNKILEKTRSITSRKIPLIPYRYHI